MDDLTLRSCTALLIVDVQNGVVAGALNRDAVVANIASLVEKARSEDVPVIWVQHSSAELPKHSDAWQYVPELPILADELVVHKEYGDAFEDTTLSDELARRDVRRLIVAGAQTDACIRSTLHGAFTRGYDTVLVSDGHTTEDLTDYGAPSVAQVIAHTNMYWSWQAAPGRTAEVVPTAEISFTMAEPANSEAP